MPLIRYRTRDVTRFIEEPCACDVILRRISRIRGRCEEMVVMVAGNMHPQIFEDVLDGVEGVSSAWQVAVRQQGVRDILEFRLELTNGVDSAAVESAIRKNLETRWPDVWANHLCGMYQLAFRFLPTGALHQGQQPRKANRLVAQRVE